MTYSCVCICCKQHINDLVSDVSIFPFPKDKELREKWLLAIDKKACGSWRICSQHFREEDFRYSIVGGKRFLKKGAIPSLYLKERNLNELCNSQNATSKENQLIGMVNKHTVKTTEIKSLNVAKSETECLKDDQYPHVIERYLEITVGDTCKNQIVSQECYNKSSVPEKILQEPSSSGSNEPAKKHKKCLYDIRWEEVSTSPVQAKIYWEVVIEKIMQQKEILKNLRPKVKRLKKKVQDLHTQIKKINSKK